MKTGLDYFYENENKVSYIYKNLISKNCPFSENKMREYKMALIFAFGLVDELKSQAEYYKSTSQLLEKRVTDLEMDIEAGSVEIDLSDFLS